jgi:hypothetical protein
LDLRKSKFSSVLNNYSAIFFQQKQPYLPSSLNTLRISIGQNLPTGSNFSEFHKSNLFVPDKFSKDKRLSALLWVSERVKYSKVDGDSASLQRAIFSRSSRIPVDGVPVDVNNFVKLQSA